MDKSNFYNQTSYSSVLTLVFVLLAMAASRILLLNNLPLDQHEVWSIWQTYGSPRQILAWTPAEGSPGYYLVLGVWRSLTGDYSITARYLSVLAFMIGVSTLYRVTRRLAGERAGVLSALVYAAFAYGILLSTEVSGYALLMGFMPFSLWLTIRYFYHSQIRRGVLLGLCLAAMFYTAFTSIGACFMLGVYTAIVYGKQIWRWWLPSVVTIALVLPGVLSGFALNGEQIEAPQARMSPPLLQELSDFYGSYVEPIIVLWVAIGLLALAAILYHRLRRREFVTLLLCTTVVPFLIYMLNPDSGLAATHVLWWMVAGLAILISWGLSLLLQAGRGVISILLVGMMVLPIPLEPHIDLEALVPLEANFRWLSDHMTTGDVFVADPGHTCGAAEEWDYYSRTYIPMGMTFPDHFEGYRRVWYISHTQAQNETLFSRVQDGRILNSGIGPDNCRFQLYVAPPDPEGILFDNGMRFHGIDTMEADIPWTGALVRREGESIRFRLWWSTDRSLDEDYKIGTYLLRSSNMLAVALERSPQLVLPLASPSHLRDWTPGQMYIEERVMTLAYPSPRTTFFLKMAIYLEESQVRVSGPGVDEDGLLSLANVRVMAW